MEEAKTLVSEAIQAGILNDLGSGSNVDLCVITHRGVEYLRPYKEACQKGVRQETTLTNRELPLCYRPK